MLGDVELTSDKQFQRRFRQMNIVWLFIAIVYASSFVYAVLNGEPMYFRDWRGIAIIGLTALIIGIYSLRIFSANEQWPVPLRFSLSIWLSLYLVVVLLSLIDNTFCWLLYIVFGMSFSLFGSRRLLLAVASIAVTLFAFQGLFLLPITSGQVISVVGQGISIFAMTAVAMLSQRLIGDRYARNELLAKLTQSNRELEEAHHKLATSVMQEQELAVLRERTRLARDVHDTLGHALVLISVKLEVAQRLRTIDPERCDHELETTKEIVRETMKELRASIADLRSPALEHESVYRAISRYAQEMAQRAGLRVTCDLHAGNVGSVESEELPEQVEETLWKVGQEALTNIEKHAQATAVVLHISRQDDHICMRIEDDGIGLTRELLQWHEDGSSVVGASPIGHYGLSGMFERVERIGGHITFHPGSSNAENAKGKPGTTVEVELPLIEVS